MSKERLSGDTKKKHCKKKKRKERKPKNNNLKNTKKPSTEWEKIFANDMYDKGLISKICQYKKHTSISKK